ncbi:hypothetical protein MZM54_00355 [[Brevibacterium] frigoritolerans]|nr:hypothetical protein [Peribacillus frigoritolerans]
MKSLRKRAVAKTLGQKYKTTRLGCMVIDKYGSMEVCYIFPNDILLKVLKRSAGVV